MLGYFTSTALRFLSNISLAYMPVAVHTLSFVESVVQTKKEASVFKRVRKRATSFSRS